MGFITVIITLTSAGTNTGPFDIYTDADNFANAIATNISRNDLLTGYSCTIVPDTATVIRVKSTGECTNFIDLPISGLITPTPTVTPTHTPTPTPTHTSTPTPTPTPAPNTIMVSLKPVTTVYNTTQHNKLTAILTLSQPLATGQSFRLHFTNSVYILGTGTGNIVANAGRNLDGNQTTDRAHVNITSGNASQTVNGSVVVNSSNLINNLFFYVDVYGPAGSPEYEADAVSTLTSAVAVTGGGNYIIDPNFNMIEAYINPAS